MAPSTIFFYRSNGTPPPLPFGRGRPRQSALEIAKSSERRVGTSRANASPRTLQDISASDRVVSAELGSKRGRRVAADDRSPGVVSSRRVLTSPQSIQTSRPNPGGAPWAINLRSPKTRPRSRATRTRIRRRLLPTRRRSRKIRTSTRRSSSRSPTRVRAGRFARTLAASFDEARSPGRVGFRPQPLPSSPFRFA